MSIVVSTQKYPDRNACPRAMNDHPDPFPYGAVVYVGIGIAVCIAAGYPAAAFGQRTLAGLLAIGAVAGIAGVIYLAVKNRRLFIDIKMTGGLTREEAMSEWYRRYGSS